VPVRVVFPQTIETREPQAPEKSWTRTCEGPEDTVTVWVVDCATNVYQTSDLFVAPQPVRGGVYVAALIVPAVVTQEVEEVREMAPLQRSLAGWAMLLTEKKRRPLIMRKPLSGWLYHFIKDTWFFG
jgi:hypothetical protein